MPSWLSTTLKLGLSFGLCALLLAHVDWDQMRGQLVGASIPLLLLGAIFVFIQFFLTALRWAVVLRLLKTPLGTWQAVKIATLSNTFSQLLPVASGGDVVRVWQGVRAGMRLSTSMNSVVLERLTGLLALIGLLCLSLPTLLVEMPDPNAQISLFAAILALFGGMILLLAGRYILRPFTRWRLFRYIVKLSEDTHAIIAAGRWFVALLAISTAGLLCWCFAVYLFAHAVHLPLSIKDSIVLVLPVILILALPFSLTGWGVREGAMVLTLGLAGLSYEQALLVSLLTGLAFLMTGLPGAFMILFLGKKRALGDMPETMSPVMTEATSQAE